MERVDGTINCPQGPLAQLVERCIRIAKVRSSTLLWSTKSLLVTPKNVFSVTMKLSILDRTNGKKQNNEIS